MRKILNNIIIASSEINCLYNFQNYSSIRHAKNIWDTSLIWGSRTENSYILKYCNYAKQ